MDIFHKQVVRLEDRKFSIKLGAHRRERTACIDAEVAETLTAELDIVIGVIAVGLREM